MAAHYHETEIKLHVPDLSAAAERLAALGAVLTSPRVLERNLRFDDAARSLTAAQQVLRLRYDTRARLTFKDDSDTPADQPARTRFEAETEVADFDAMRLILARLGFTPYMTYEKYRTTYHFGAVEVTLDELPYGNFIEIEGDHAEISAARAALGLDGARVIRPSYTVIFEALRQRMGLNFTDLTFANFEGIVVPPGIFSELA